MTRSRARRKPLAWLLAGLFVLVLAGGLAFYSPFHESQAGAISPGEDAPELPPLPGKRITFLVMGVDEREDDVGRADSMMVVTYDPATQQLSALSIARDTWVEIPGHGYDKVNHSYAFGREKLAVATVQRLLGIPIDYAVLLSFQGFQKVIDAVGGVQIEAEKRMYYHDPTDTSMGPDGLLIDIQPGLQLMDGETALKYARFRSDEEGDFGRMRRQQQVFKELMRTAATPAIVGKLPQLIPAMGETVQTDLPVVQMLRLAASGKDALAKPLKTGTFSGQPQSIGGIFYLIPDLVAQRAAAYELLVGSPPDEAFRQRARDRQKLYDKALAETLAAARAAAEAEAKERERAAQEEADKQPPADHPTPDPGAEAPAPGGGPSPDPGPVPGTNAPTKPPAKPPAKTQPVTIAVIDASGGRIGQEYADQLKAAGFRVARVARASQPIARTVILDHAGQQAPVARLQALLPGAMVVAAPDEKANEAIEVILGSDLLKPAN